MFESIYECIYQFFLMDEEALPMLIQEMRPITITAIYDRIGCRYISEAERTECLILADQVLSECLMTSRTDYYPAFRSFYKLCLRNRLIDYGRHIQYHSLGPSVEVIYLDKMVREDMNHYVAEIIEDNRNDTHFDVMTKIEKENFEREARVQFSTLELRVLELHRIGYTNREISEKLDMTLRKVRYILNKIKKWYHVI